MTFPFGSGRRDVLPVHTAEQMLSNVFTACGREQNTVPLEALLSYSNYRKERYAIQRTVIVLMLTVFLLVPLLFVAAGVRVTLADPDSDANPVYTVSVSSGIPIRQIQACMDGRNVPLYEVSPGEYVVEPRANGQMRVSVTLLNRQYTSVELTVDSVDSDAPELLSTETTAEGVIFHLSDSGSGVDYAGITITDPDGNAVQPLGFDAGTGCVLLPYPQRTLLVRIPDMRGNVLQIDLMPQTQS